MPPIASVEDISTAPLISISVEVMSISSSAAMLISPSAVELMWIAASRKIIFLFVAIVKASAAAIVPDMSTLPLISISVELSSISSSALMSKSPSAGEPMFIALSRN